MGAGEAQRAAKRLYALAHARQAKALLAGARRQAAAVVFNHQRQAIVLLAALNGDRAGIGVFDDIIQPFLTDAEQRHALAFAQRRFANAPVEMADNAAAFQLHLAHQGTHRLLQRQVVKLARAQSS